MKAILFDWDGTLADTLGAIYQANVAVMAAFQLPFDPLRYRRHFAPDWRLMYERLGVPADRLLEANERWWAALDEGETRLFPGARAALDQLRGAGHPLGLVTAGNSARVAAELRRHELDGFFASTIYGDDSFEDGLTCFKPDPRPLRRALREMGYGDRPGEAVYIGDTPDDIRMALAAGVEAVGIASILGDPDELLAIGASETAISIAAWVNRRFRC